MNIIMTSKENDNSVVEIKKDVVVILKFFEMLKTKHNFLLIFIDGKEKVYSTSLEITPAPIVLPPSRIANLKFSSRTISE